MIYFQVTTFKSVLVTLSCVSVFRSGRQKTLGSDKGFMTGYEAQIGQDLEGFEVSDYEDHWNLVRDLTDFFEEADNYRVISYGIFSDFGEFPPSEPLKVGEIHGVLEDSQQGFELEVRRDPVSEFKFNDAPEYELGIEPAEYVEEVDSELPDVMNPQFL